jgi:hypothetical protein
VTPRDDDSLVSVDELVSVLREHEGPPQPVANGAAKQLSRRRRTRQAALLVAAVAIALLVGSGLGFGLGSSVTPSGSARDNVVGYGFLPARSWNVMQSGAVAAGSKAHAVAANVALRETRAPDAVPYATLESLPRGGIVISATFGLRGDPGEDFKFPVGSLPLRMSNAELVGPIAAPEIAQYRLRAGVGGSNVDVRIYFGDAAPSQRLLEAAERQLERLVVSSEQVTIAARPAIVPQDRPVTLFGAVDNGRGGEEVEIQAKDCGQSFFRVVSGATTREGGGWSTEYFPLITTTVRAVWKGRASSQVTVRQRAILRFVSKPADRTRFVVSVVARAQFWRKKVTIQRFDRRLGRWDRFRSVVLTEQASPGSVVWTSGEFTARLPRGTMLRAVFPAAQAGPCYVSGTSLPVRT